MPNFGFRFEREIVVTEWVERVISAPDKAAAQAIASDMARGFNSACPDDASENSAGGHFESWRVTDDGTETDVEADEA